MRLYTKAQMLNYIKESLPAVNILPMVIIHSRDFFACMDEEISKVIEFANNRPLIVRSSSSNEDMAECSNAGKYESIQNVLPEYNAIKKSIQQVYDSYQTDANEEVLIQPMLADIQKSGVVFTLDKDTLADYYIVNYSILGDSDAVTAGRTNDLKTYVQYKFCDISVEDVDMQNLLTLCRTIETFLNNNALDIEFAVGGGQIYIFQVRPIAVHNETQCKKDITPVINRIYKKVQKLSARHPFLLGHTTCFGVMPDWNPAEILGVRPKKMAISLYKELITDNIWARQRLDYGYRDLTMHPLMISFCGIPYIDTRITFNSFIPKHLNTSIAEKLVDYYLDRLTLYPKYHDKIEFEIVFSCYYLGIHDELRKLLDGRFNENEITRIEFALLELTNRIISPNSGLYKQDLAKAVTLEKNYQKIVDSDISLIDKIYWLIEECKAYGTLPFAGVARAAFIAVQFLQSFVKIGIMDHSEYDAYMNSLNTINKKMNRDLQRYYQGELSKEGFLSVYGHIRPGTYDIMSQCYEEAFDFYFKDGISTSIESCESDFYFSTDKLSRIEAALEENGLLITADELMKFIKESIEGREYLKFVFTKCVNKILQLIEELGHRVNIKKEDMAYLDISLIKQLYVDLYTGDIRTVFEENIRNNKNQYESAIQIKLPSVIVKPKDVYSFFMLNEEPNYITQKSIMGDIAVLQDGNYDIEGKIVFIQAADPGYDFIFSKSIGGLITQYGGTNSHMAIRCAELGIPAVIGVGEQNYIEWSRYKRILVDCQKKQVIKIC